jgi:hypothetical protein
MAAKVNFNEITKIITITLAPDASGEIFIDAKTDLYSDGKEDWVLNENLRKFAFPIRSVGGDDLPGSKALGATFFLASDWKIRPYEASHKLVINGNLYSEDGSDPFLDTIGTFTVRIIQQVSSLVDSTVQQLREIEYASYGGCVTVDTVNGVPGTTYNIGTIENPVDNIADALLIDNERFNKLCLVSNILLNSGNNLAGYTIEGRSHINTLVTIESSAIVDDINIYNCHLTGVMDGGVDVTFCVIENLTYMSGHIHQSSLQGTLILGGTEDAFIVNCSQADNDIIPIISMGGSGQNLVMPNYAGYIKIKNLTGSNKAYVGLNYGKVILDTATVTSGTVEVGGIGYLADELENPILTGTWNSGVTIINGLVNKETVANAVMSENIYDYDTISGSLGLTVDKIKKETGLIPALV